MYEYADIRGRQAGETIMEITYIEEIKRKLVHLSSLWMAAATLLLPRNWSCLLFLLLLLLTLVSEHDYANGGRYLGKLYGKIFGKMLRDKVKPGQWIVSGGAPVLAAALLVNVLFPPFIAASSLAVMLTGDAAAALVEPIIRRPQIRQTQNGQRQILGRLCKFHPCWFLCIIDRIIDPRTFLCFLVLGPYRSDPGCRG